MTNQELFASKNTELFMPDGVEFIYNVLENIGFVNYTSIEAKEKGLDAIQKLLELELIEVFHWGEYHNELKDKDISNEEIMKHIDEVWFIGADFEHFISMPMFKYKNWYLNSLEKEGLTMTTNWKKFVKEKIGDLEQWIEENRPKD